MVLKARFIVDLGVMKQYGHCDVVEHNGEHWLVPQWVNDPTARVRRPARMVSLKFIPHETVRGEYQFLIIDPLPKWLLDGSPGPRDERKRFAILNYPEIEFPLGPHTPD